MTTIEDFFIKEYERVVAENNDLKKRISEFENSGETFGVFDLHQPKEFVRVDAESGTYFWEETGLSKEQLIDLANLSKDEFIKKCKEIKDGNSYYSSPALSVKNERYRYSISVRDMDGVREFAFDDTKNPDLIDLNGEPELRDWTEQQHLDQLLRMAVSELREGIGNRIEEIEQEEAKAGEQDANE